MNIISNLVRKLYSVLSHQKRRVRTRLLLPVAGIHPSTLIDYGRIQPKKACTLTIDELCQVDGTIIFEQEHASVDLRETSVHERHHNRRREGYHR